MNATVDGSGDHQRGGDNWFCLVEPLLFFFSVFINHPFPFVWFKSSIWFLPFDICCVACCPHRSARILPVLPAMVVVVIRLLMLEYVCLAYWHCVFFWVIFIGFQRSKAQTQGPFSRFGYNDWCIYSQGYNL